MFPLHKNKGKLIFDREAFDLYLASLRDGRFTVTVKKLTRPRTIPQNKLYWAWLNIVSEHSGHSPTELHEIFKRKFLPPEYISYRGKEIKLPNTTTKLTTSDFTIFLERVRVEASELGIILPSADEL